MAPAHSVLEHQFESLEQQHEAATLGIWVFLATEVLFFGVMFTGLGVYLHTYPDAFEKASQHLNWLIGGINTAVLLCSSLTMALAVHHAQLGQRKQLILFLIFTASLGGVFLVFKGIEYYSDFVDKLVPGLAFDPEEWQQEKVNPAEVKLFLMFYYIMTLIHALHLTIGIGVVIAIAVLAQRGRYSREYYSPVDVTGLYWHFVDIVWLFLLPMLYLVGTHTHL